MTPRFSQQGVDRRWVASTVGDVAVLKAPPGSSGRERKGSLLFSQFKPRRGGSLMSKMFKAALAAMVACGLMLLGGTGIASAQDGPARLSQVVPMSGKTTKGNKQFTGTYTIDKFISKGGKIYSVGTVKGKLG